MTKVLADKILLGHSLGGVVAWACWQGSCTCSSLLRLAASLQLWDAGLCCAWAHSWRHGWGQSLYEKDNNDNYIVIENYNDIYNDNGNGNGNDNNEN